MLSLVLVLDTYFLIYSDPVWICQKETTLWSLSLFSQDLQSCDLRSWLQFLFFFMFLVIYLITMVGNLGLMALIWKDGHLHMPMYLFLGGLPFANAYTPTSVTPRMLVNFLDKTTIISLVKCIT